LLTELIFKGKEFVYNHHLAVPFRPLVPDAGKSIGEPRLDGNLIVHGDNLHALKALLPLYAGKVDCIFIDPPYNTGNEGWCYNDNVNSPLLKEWLRGNPVGIEDGLRHDKWCAMMYPRLRLLHEMLSGRGSLWITLDDNEIHHARCMLDEIFGEGNFIADIAWHARESVQNDTDISTNNLNYLFGYAKNRRKTGRRLKESNVRTWFDEPSFVFLPKEIDADRYSNPDDDPRGPWKADPFDAPNVRENLTYAIVNPNTNEEHWPPAGRCWRTEESNYLAWLEDNRILFGANGRGRPQLKVFAEEKSDYGEVETNWWDGPATTTDAIKALAQIMPGREFDNPKPVELIQKLLRHISRPDSIVLDSFAGSGTTAHAVLAQNAKDGGHRRFILVEGEDYADPLTAERVRRVINGYEFAGTQREELLRENITWSALSKPSARDRILDHVQSVENLEGPRFDRIKKAVKDGELIVTGEKDVAERAEGLGGGFTYCTLGAAIELDALLTGESLPAFDALGAVLFHMATNTPFDPLRLQMHDDGIGLLGSAAGTAVWLVYKPELDWLKSKDAALTLERARQFAVIDASLRHLVFAPARFVSQKLLDSEGLKVEFAPLPYALYRIERV
jgi:adenine-specific DNA-methyltransferase